MSSRIPQPKAEPRAAAETGFSGKGRGAVQQSRTGNELQQAANNSAQSQKAAVVQAMADRHFSTAETIQKRANTTGLPDQLKSGIENLSGHSLDDVKVHYNSPKPAQLQALAYAQGNQIHLAPGQQQHLPHEAWHVVQQKQGRVPATGKINGQPLNDNHNLEHEADVMGNQSLQFMRSDVAMLREKNLDASQAPVQRKPEDVFKKVSEEDSWKDKKEIQEYIREFVRLFYNAEQVKESFPTITQKSEVYTSVRSAVSRGFKELLLLVTDSKHSKKYWIDLWNKGLGEKSAKLYSEKSTYSKYQHKEPDNGFPDNDSKKYIENWYAKKKLKDKKMVPSRKLANMLPSIMNKQLSENAIVALKLFFSHTANFVPQDNLGRDFRSQEHGDYFRTSNDPVRKNNSEILKQDAKETREESGDSGMGRKKSPTYQVLNTKLLDALDESGNLSKSLQHLNMFSIEENEDYGYTEFMSHAGIHSGSLGLIQNAFRTVRTGTKIEYPKYEKTKEKVAEHVAEGLNPLVSEELLAPTSDKNYHDLMLADRANLIREVTESIENQYASAGKNEIKVVPIQSDEHASLILSLEYPSGHDEEKLSEATWRETFIEAFNGAAKTGSKDTRITHRGSFGFIYPTASSVGDPVRIWPGLVPATVFKRLLFMALKKASETVTDLHDPKFKESEVATKSDNLLHIETLKTAVRYAQQVMHETLIVQGPKKLFEWTRARLSKNLLKAQYILEQKPNKSSEDELENNYLKSTLVIENLMEYSYLLGALSKKTTKQKDPYPEYFRKKVFSKSQEDVNQQTRTFYLDSGMQSIVTAHLLARNWIVKKKGLDKKDKLDTIDLYSYFEYGMVDKTNLNLQAQNRKDDKKLGATYLGGSDFTNTVLPKFKKAPPSIIAADLNPVFTKPELRKEKVAYPDVLKHFSGNQKKKNEETIPVLDVTNASLDKVADINLGAGYENFVVVESLSKHQQLGADKFTMGRLTAVGTKEFIEFAEQIIAPIEKNAHDPLPQSYRLQMDKVFYGNPSENHSAYQLRFLETAPRYSEFMNLMGLGEKWQQLLGDKMNKSSEKKEQQGLYIKYQALLNEAFESYAKQVSDTKQQPNLSKAFESLPVSDQQQLLQKAQFALEIKDIPVEVSKSFLVNTSQTGITNAGNTCYLAAALNMIAFSHYYDLFAPRNEDPKSELRASVKAILDMIHGGTLVPYDELAILLVSLSHHQLLEAPNLQGMARSLTDQRDPAEVMEYVLGYFGVDSPDNNMQLSQEYNTRMHDNYQNLNVDANQYSQVDDNGNFATQRRSDWIIKLPISEASHLQTALARYLKPEQIQQVKGNFRGGAISGTATRRVSFGNEAPKVISIQLIRWILRDGMIDKDSRAIHMPDQFRLNNYVYTLTAVIYHHGVNPDEGHYTASTLHQDKGWQYRNDENVSKDKKFEERKKFGYMYTYVRTEQINENDNSLLDFKNPGNVDLHRSFPSFNNKELALEKSGSMFDVSNQSILKLMSQQNPIVQIKQGSYTIAGPFSGFMNMLSHLRPRNNDDLYLGLSHIFKKTKRSFNETFDKKERSENEMAAKKKRPGIVYEPIEFEFTFNPFELNFSEQNSSVNSNSKALSSGKQKSYHLVLKPKKNLFKQREKELTKKSSSSDLSWLALEDKKNDEDMKDDRDKKDDNNDKEDENME